MKKKIIVIGGGPAGMIAAGKASESGAEVILLEKMDKVGLKLSLTGKGKCNLTNTEPVISTFVENYGRNGIFLINCYQNFFNKDLISFFNELDLKLKEESGGRIYPLSENSQDVVDSLKNYLKKNKVNIKINTKANEVLHYKNKVGGVISSSGVLLSDAVIIATGGASYPQTGSTGDGYKMVKQVGHKVTPRIPVLVPLETKESTKELKGLKLKNISAKIYENDRKIAEEFGECFFTESSIDGAVALKLSREAKEEIQTSELKLQIDLKPALSHSKLDKRIIREINQNGKKQYRSLLKNLLPAKLIERFQKITNIPFDKKMANISKEERELLVNSLKNFEFTIKGTRPLEEAIVTSGGVELNQIDPRTMESKIIDGLYFAGEIIDVDGDTGGYNLQFAFSTGYLAGKSATEDIA